jgi:hypothetical protein
VRLGVQRSSRVGDSAEKRDEVLRSLIIDVQRKRFSPPPEPFGNSRPPIVDARRGLGSKENVRAGNGAPGSVFPILLPNTLSTVAFPRAGTRTPALSAPPLSSVPPLLAPPLLH